MKLLLALWLFAQVPHTTALELHNMYLESTTHVTDLTTALADNPNTPYWAHCGATVDYLLRSGIPARKVSLWNWPGYEHQAMEIYSETHKKFYFYDPFYGVVFLLPTGEPASVADILEDISTHGFAYQKWRAQPTRIQPYRPAADAWYEEYNRLNYGWSVARNYFSVIAVRHTDTTHYPNTQLPGETVARGRWTVYDNTSATGMSATQQEYFIDTLKRSYAVQHNGRYYMTIYKLQR